MSILTKYLNKKFVNDCEINEIFGLIRNNFPNCNRIIFNQSTLLYCDLYNYYYNYGVVDDYYNDSYQDNLEADIVILMPDKFNSSSDSNLIELIEKLRKNTNIIIDNTETKLLITMINGTKLSRTIQTILLSLNRMNIHLPLEMIELIFTF